MSILPPKECWQPAFCSFPVNITLDFSIVGITSYFNFAINQSNLDQSQMLKL